MLEFGSDHHTRNPYVEILRVMEDTMKYIQRQRNSKVFGGLTDMVRFVHGEFVSRKVDEIELDGVNDHVEIKQVEERFPLPRQALTATRLFDTLISPESNQNRCILVYKTGKEIKREFELNYGIPSYPFFVTPYIRYLRDWRSGELIGFVTQSEADRAARGEAEIDEVIWKLQNDLAEKELNLVSATCEAQFDYFDQNSDGDVTYNDLLGSFDADGDGDFDGSDIIFATSKAFQNNVGDFSSIEKSLENFLKSKNTIPSAIDKLDYYVNTKWFGALMEYVIATQKLIFRVTDDPYADKMHPIRMWRDLITSFFNSYDKDLPFCGFLTKFVNKNMPSFMGNVTSFIESQR